MAAYLGADRAVADLEALLDAYAGGTVRRVPVRARALVLRYLESRGVRTPSEARILGLADATGIGRRRPRARREAPQGD